MVIFSTFLIIQNTQYLTILNATLYLSDRYWQFSKSNSTFYMLYMGEHLCIMWQLKVLPVTVCKFQSIFSFPWVPLWCPEMRCGRGWLLMVPELMSRVHWHSVMTSGEWELVWPHLSHTARQWVTQGTVSLRLWII